MLVDVAIFHGIIKKVLPPSEIMYCLRATKIEDPLIFQSPPNSFIVIIAYLFIGFFSSKFIFPSCVFALPKQIRLMEGSQHYKDSERCMNIYYRVTSEPDRPLAVKGIVRR